MASTISELRLRGPQRRDQVGLHPLGHEHRGVVLQFANLLERQFAIVVHQPQAELRAQAEVVGAEVCRVPGRIERRVQGREIRRRVAVLHVAARRIEKLRQVGGRVKPGPDLGSARRGHGLGLVRRVGQGRDRAVPEKENVAHPVCVSDVEHRDEVQLQHALELGEVLGLGQLQPLFIRPMILITGAAEHERLGLIAMDHRAQRRVPERAGFARRGVAFDLQGHVIAHERHRAAVEQVMVGSRRIERQLVDLLQVGAIDRVRPAQVLVPTRGQNRPADEGRPIKVQLPGHGQVRLVIGRHRRPRLVRIAQQHGPARLAAAGGQGPHVRADLTLLGQLVLSGGLLCLWRFLLFQKVANDVVAVKGESHHAGHAIGRDVVRRDLKSPLGAGVPLASAARCRAT